jgi:hypothetical protein
MRRSKLDRKSLSRGYVDLNDIENLRKGLHETVTSKYSTKFCSILQTNAIIPLAHRVDQIITWLANTSPPLEHTVARAKHQPNTGVRLFQIHQYLQWKTSPMLFLWVYGIPGCGKIFVLSVINGTSKF